MRIISIISPGKSASGNFAHFRAPQVQVEVRYDTEFVTQLCKLADAAGFPAGTEGERDRRLDQGTIVPLYFINQYVKEYRLVRMFLFKNTVVDPAITLLMK